MARTASDERQADVASHTTFFPARVVSGSLRFHSPQAARFLTTPPQRRGGVVRNTGNERTRGGLGLVVWEEDGDGMDGYGWNWERWMKEGGWKGKKSGHGKGERMSGGPGRLGQGTRGRLGRAARRKSCELGGSVLNEPLDLAGENGAAAGRERIGHRRDERARARSRRRRPWSSQLAAARPSRGRRSSAVTATCTASVVSADFSRGRPGFGSSCGCCVVRPAGFGGEPGCLPARRCGRARARDGQVVELEGRPVVCVGTPGSAPTAVVSLLRVPRSRGSGRKGAHHGPRVRDRFSSHRGGRRMFRGGQRRRAAPPRVRDGEGHSPAVTPRVRFVALGFADVSPLGSLGLAKEKAVTHVRVILWSGVR